MTSDPPGYTLAHPIYLDVPMMVSFLAAIEGGVSVSGSETSTQAGSQEKTLAGKLGLKAKILGLADGEASVEGSTHKTDETTFVSQTERHHTAASLFNILIAYLREAGQIVEICSEDDLASLKAGQLVELQGESRGNPLESILTFASAIFPYVVPDEPATTPPPPNPRSGNPQKRGPAPAPTPAAPPEDDTVRMIRMMAADMQAAPVHDLLFETSPGLRFIAVTTSEFYTPATSEHLRQGYFRVVGKVTRVLAGTDSINLARRTVIGAGGSAMVEELISSFRDLDSLSLDVADPIVSGPALQLLPMAIYL